MRWLALLGVGICVIVSGCATEGTSYWRSVGLNAPPLWNDGRKMTPDEHRACRARCAQIATARDEAARQAQVDRNVNEFTERQREQEVWNEWARREIRARLKSANADGVITKAELSWAAVGMQPERIQKFASRGQAITEIWYIGEYQYVFENNILTAVNKW